MANSHVQITQGLMKGFGIDGSKRNPRVYSLDLKTGDISSNDVRKLGAIPNYYSKDVEKYLSREVEDAFGKVVHKVRDFMKGRSKKPSLQLKEKEILAVVKFSYFAFIRSSFALNTTNSSSQTVPFLGDVSGNEMILSMSHSDFTSFHTGRQLSILRNNTNYGFILPQNCFYQAPSPMTQGFFYEILPISPETAFIFYQREEFLQLFNATGYNHSVVEDIEIVKRLNQRAYLFEKFMNGGFVVANREKELIDLLNLK